MRPEALELTRLAELAQDWPLLGEAAAQAALSGSSAITSRRRRPQSPFGPCSNSRRRAHLLPSASCASDRNLARQFGRGEEAHRLLERGLTASDGGTDQATLWLDWGVSASPHGDPEEGLTWLEKAKAEFERLGDVREEPSPWARSPISSLPAAISTRRCASAARSSCRSLSGSAMCAPRAVTMGKIADILLRPRRSRRGAAHPPARVAAWLMSGSAMCAQEPSPWARSPISFQPRRSRRGVAHPPRGAVAGL